MIFAIEPICFLLCPQRAIFVQNLRVETVFNKARTWHTWQTVAGSPTLRLFPIFGPPFLLHCLAHLHIPSISRGTIPGYLTIRKASVDGIYLATMVHTSALALIDAGTVRHIRSPCVTLIDIVSH